MDENVDFRFVKELRKTLADHLIFTAQDVRLVGNSPAMAGLNEIQKDRKLCEMASVIGFDVLVVTDRGFERQQDLQNLPVNVLFLDPRPEDATVEHLRKLIPRLQQQLTIVANAQASGSPAKFLAIRGAE